MSSSLVSNPVDRDSSSELPNISGLPERRDDQTANTQILDQQDHFYHQSQNTARDPDTTTDPASVPGAAIVAATRATNSAHTRLVSRSPAPTSAASSIRYLECLRNHVANMGGHVVDGCGEFMASGEEGTPESLRCAACECHRNFHRKVVDGEPSYLANYHYKNNGQRTTILPYQQLTTSLAPQQPSFHQHLRHHLGTAPIAPIMMTFDGAAAESSSEDLNRLHSNLQAQASVQPSSSSKKRFRTKFTQEQKDKMMELAEKLDWKIQKQNDQEVQQFCSQVGIKRKVFKVWMHNNKQAMKKKQM